MKLIIILASVLLIQPAFAGGRHDDGDSQTINNIYNQKSPDDTGKAVLISVAVVCFAPQAVYNYAWPAIVGLFTLSKPKFKHWSGVCWPSESVPTPATKNDVTPDLKNGVRLYQ